MELRERKFHSDMVLLQYTQITYTYSMWMQSKLSIPHRGNARNVSMEACMRKWSAVVHAVNAITTMLLH